MVEMAHAHSRKSAYDKLSRFVTRRVWCYGFSAQALWLDVKQLKTMVKRVGPNRRG